MRKEINSTHKFNTYSRLCLISPSLGDLDVGPGDYQMNPNCLDIEAICNNKKITLSTACSFPNGGHLRWCFMKIQIMNIQVNCCRSLSYRSG